MDHHFLRSLNKISSTFENELQDFTSRNDDLHSSPRATSFQMYTTLTRFNKTPPLGCQQGNIV